jgi:hypothetical protein
VLHLKEIHMAYGKYGHGSENYGYGSPVPQPQEPAKLSSQAKALRDAIDRLVKGSTQNDPNTRAIEDGVARQLVGRRPLMPYSLLSDQVTPASFGSGMQGGLGGLLGRWGDATQRGLYGGMQLGNELTKYGSSQRLAGAEETARRQALNTGMVKSQNSQLDAQTAQQKLACDRIGWGSPYCQNLKAQAEGRIPAVGAQGGPMTNSTMSGSAGPMSGGFGPSSVLGVDENYDSYDQQGGQSQDWY